MRPLTVRDAHQVGVLRLELEDLLRMPREHLLVALLVAKPRVGQRSQDREPVGDLGMAGEQLADPDAGRPRRDRAERARAPRPGASGLGS